VSYGLVMVYDGGLVVTPAMACVKPANFSSSGLSRLGGYALRKSSWPFLWW